MNGKMKNNEMAKKMVDGALESLNGIQRATANPFLYTRVMARINQANSTWEQIARFVGRPAIAFGAIICFLALNIWVAFYQQDNKVEKIQQTEAEQLFASEFNQTNYSLMETINDK